MGEYGGAHARHGSAPEKLSTLAVRSKPVRMTLRPAEWDDLVAIAEAWGVAPATAAWAMCAGFMAECRGQRPELAELGLAVVAARQLPVDGPTPVSKRLTRLAGKRSVSSP